MIRFLIFIKHHIRILWSIIEKINSVVFTLLYKSSFEKVLVGVLDENRSPPYCFRRLMVSDASSLYSLINSQEKSDLKYFKPHDFDLNSIIRQFDNQSFLMFGAFLENKMIGYFFLRCFISKKCFVGRIVDKEYRGQGIGLKMNKIMYETSWGMSFRCLSTISLDNEYIVKAHSKNFYMVFRKKMPNNYILVEFMEQGDS